MRRYFLSTLAAAATASACIVVFLYSVDPFAILHFNNGDIYRVDEYIRISKPHWAEGDWDAVVVGSSVSLRGIQPGAVESSYPDVRKAFNFAVDGATAYELRRHSEHAMAVAPIRRLLLEARPFLLGGVRAPLQFSEKRMAVDADGAPQPLWRRSDWAIALFSASALQRGLEILVPGREKRVYRSNGSAEFAERSTYKALMNAAPKISRRHARTSREHLENLAHVLKLACARSVSVDVYFPPVHAFALEALYRNGADRFDAAKRSIVNTVAEVASTCGDRARFVVWDFMTYSAVATERVGGPEKDMINFVDATHFKRDVGRRLVSTMAGGTDGSLPGTLLTPDNVDAHLKRQRQLREEWHVRQSRSLRMYERATRRKPGETRRSTSARDTGGLRHTARSGKMITNTKPVH